MTLLVINAAGLHADIIAETVGLNMEKYKLHRCKTEFINFIGIESLGLTISPVIAEIVKKIVDDIL